MVLLRFDRGTLLLDDRLGEGLPPSLLLPESRRDGRVGGQVRVPAHHYHVVVRSLVAHGIPFTDEARAYGEVPAPGELPAPRPYQEEAVAAWNQARRRGVVVLPTGTGKSLVAVLAIASARRSALVVVPTLDLLNQWHGLLAKHFGGEEAIGAIGGGEHEVRDLTVTTYDSAYLHLDRLGNRFGLVVFDEVHHLGGPSYLQSAHMALAPYRLGLTATPDDGERWSDVEAALGPIVYRREIGEMAGSYLSDYDAVRVTCHLSESERQAHDEARQRYRDFVEAKGLRLGGRYGWARFLEATNRSREGRAAFAAWREQRRIAMAAPAKLDHLERLLERHRGERVLVFTHTNKLAHAISRRFLVPTITHQTKGPERRAILQGLRDGTLPVVATSRVLNEGVDVPAVGVAVVLSGTATVREHVQRLGRILRRAEGKEKAVLYEVVTEDTAEEATSQRRRKHDAYR
jgi:superfamily II DNA or RNA helicase